MKLSMGVLGFLFFGWTQSYAQTDFSKLTEQGNYKFTIQKTIDANPVQNQYKTSTCWSFSTLSFLESEILRTSGKKVQLSEMFVVYHTYLEKAERYVRMHGAQEFGPGGAFEDNFTIINKYGIVPESVYSGKNIGEENHMHNELDAALKAYVDAIIKNPNGKLSPVWKEGLKGILTAYLGELPTEFEVDGTTYTPKSYAEFLGINEHDYVALTSFTHHDFYKPFFLEVPDNWNAGFVHNLPLNEFMQVINNAVNNGYSVAWASDVSDKGFAHRSGVAVVPELDWSAYSKTERDSLLKNPHKQRVITQEMRQVDFDNYETTDDHGMHIIGSAKDQNGTLYYIVKNSWGTKSNDCDGYLFVSEAFAQFKTMDIVVHKSAVPKAILKKLNL